MEFVEVDLADMTTIRRAVADIKVVVLEVPEPPTSVAFATSLNGHTSFG
jgi:hypothetical protein